MGIDPELLKQLLVTFKTELQEQSQVMIDGLLALEKDNVPDRAAILQACFRSAHNIKGTARSLGIENIGEISHRLESIFSYIQHDNILLSKPLADLCLESIDKMRECMLAYLDNKPVSFDLKQLLTQLEKSISNKSEQTTSQAPSQIEIEPVVMQKVETNTADKNESIHVAVEKINKVSMITEEIQVNKISLEDHNALLIQIVNKCKVLNETWRQMRATVKTPLADELNDNLLETTALINHAQKGMRAQLNELSLLSNLLQEEVRTLRLVPIANLFFTFPRYVRDLSQQLDKKVELEIKDDGIKIDKYVLEHLRDPIIHLLRNAIDHGIEAEAIRTQLGKPVVGHIVIAAKEVGGQVTITITDDGGGIDTKRIADVAVQKKLVTRAEVEHMPIDEIYALMFRPGFSTREIITDISGRGVGLNVVKTNVSELKGDIKVTSILGKSTTFSLNVPITLSSERGLLVSACEQRFVIPISAVQKTLELPTNEVIHIAAGEAIFLDKHTIPLYSLANVLNLPGETQSFTDKIFIVVIKDGPHSVALIVDNIIGEREIVIKRLQEPLTNNIPCVAGGTLLDRNQVVVVLNAMNLLDYALHRTQKQTVFATKKLSKPMEKPTILVVDDSITTRTLEKNILESKNYNVIVAVNGKEAWDLLQKQAFSLIITDVNMPIMDGFTLTEHIKSDSKLKSVPVIIVTSLGSDAEKARGIQVGANAYVVKNEFESSALLEIVEQLV